MTPRGRAPPAPLPPTPIRRKHIVTCRYMPPRRLLSFAASERTYGTAAVNTPVAMTPRRLCPCPPLGPSAHPATHDPRGPPTRRKIAHAQLTLQRLSTRMHPSVRPVCPPPDLTDDSRAVPPTGARPLRPQGHRAQPLHDRYTIVARPLSDPFRDRCATAIRARPSPWICCCQSVGVTTTTPAASSAPAPLRDAPLPSPSDGNRAAARGCPA